MKYFFLLVAKFTYLPIPQKFIANQDDLPKALCLMPLLGLLCGSVIYFSSKLLIGMPPVGAAAIMLGLNILFGGAILMRDLISVADGLSRPPLFPPNMEASVNSTTYATHEEDLIKNKSHWNVGKAGLVWGIVWLLILYSFYLWYFKAGIISNIAFLMAPVISRWLMTWAIHYFYAKPPAWLHLNFSRRDFIIASVLTLIFIVPFSRPLLFLALLISFMGVYLFTAYRQRTVGALDDYCYGASCAWAEILFLMGWMTFTHFL